MPGPAPLDGLREEVRLEDRAILEALRRRPEIARAIAAEKAVSGTPLRDFEAESRVVERFVGGLAPEGVPRGRAAALAEWLIEESVRAQEGVPSYRRPAGAESLGVAIVGGSGAMGRWLAKYLEDSGHRVRIVDPAGVLPGQEALPDVEEAAARSDVVAFATPISTTRRLLSRALAVPSKALLFDLLSVKAPIASLLRKGARSGRRVTSLHPMFGPSARTLTGRNLLVVRCGNPEADRAARRLFERSALTISEVPLERHDRLVADSLGLAHAVNLLFLGALARSGSRAPELARAASTTFHRQSALAAAVASEGARLYLDIQSLNPWSRGTYRGLRRALDELERTVGRRDLAAFRRLLARGARRVSKGPVPMRE